MPSIRVDVKFNHLARVVSQLPDVADSIVQSGGLDMQQGARRRVRVDTGALRDSIQWHPTGQGEGELVAGEGLSDIRAAANEYGTRFMPAQPYLRPAFEEVGPKIVAEFKRLEDHL